MPCRHPFFVGPTIPGPCGLVAFDEDLQRLGIVMNQRKLRRLCHEEKLQVLKRGGRKRALCTRPPILVPHYPIQKSWGRQSAGQRIDIAWFVSTRGVDSAAHLITVQLPSPVVFKYAHRRNIVSRQPSRIVHLAQDDRLAVVDVRDLLCRWSGDDGAGLSFQCFIVRP